MSSQCVSIVHVIEYESVILWLKPMRKVNEWVIFSLKWMKTDENECNRMKTDENEWKEWNKMTSYKIKWMNYVLHETSKKRLEINWVGWLPTCFKWWRSRDRWHSDTHSQAKTISNELIKWQLTRSNLFIS